MTQPQLTPSFLETLDQRITLKLSAMEWMVVLMAVTQDVTPAMAQSIRRDLSEEALRGALIAARDALIARDFARKDAEGKLELNPLMVLCVRSLNDTPKSLGLTLFDGSNPPQLFRYNFVGDVFVGSWSDKDQIQYFDFVTPAQMTDVIYSHWQAKLTLHTSTLDDGPEVVVNAALIPNMREGGPPPPSDLASALQRAGVDASDAQGVAHALTKPDLRATLVSADNLHDPLTVRSFIWLSNHKHLWVVKEHPSDEAVIIQRVSAHTFQQAVAAFVRPIVS